MPETRDDVLNTADSSAAQTEGSAKSVLLENPRESLRILKEMPLPDSNPNAPPVLLIGDIMYFNSPQPKVEKAAKDVYQKISDANFKIVQPDGTGSGFLANTKGDIITNSHVVSGVVENETLKVTTKAGVQLSGRVTKVDYVNDLAVINVDPQLVKDIKPIEIAEEQSVQSDQRVYALGYPLGVDTLMLSPGNVVGNMQMKSMKSGQRPEVPDVDISASDLQSRPTILLQAHTEGGNSGSPLVNTDGELVGVVFAGSGGLQGGGPKLGQTAYAVSATEVESILSEPTKYAVKYQNGVIPEPQYPQK